MHCTDFIDGYSEYDDSLLPPTRIAEFRRHLESCESCARYDRVLRKGRMLARQVSGPEPGEEFLPRLNRRLWQQRVRPQRVTPQRVAMPTLVGGLSAALVLLLAAVGAWMLEQDAAADPSLRLAAATVEHGSLSAMGYETADSHRSPGVSLAGQLPPEASLALAGWTGERVDRRVGSSYSPLVIGPPAYRARGPALESTTTASRRTLD